MEKERPGIILYWETLDVLDALPDDKCKQMLVAMRNFARYGEIPNFDGDVALAPLWIMISAKLTADGAKYDAICEKRRAAAQARWEAKNGKNDANAFDEMQKHANDASAFFAMQTMPTTTTTTTPTTATTTTTTETTTTTATTTKKEKAPTRHKYGTYGWVRLSDDEYDRLIAELGFESVDRAIAYVDESAQRTGNKNGWKDWNLVIRKCIRDKWGSMRQTPQQAPQPNYGNPFAALREEFMG